jgi:hypothetical protein
MAVIEKMKKFVRDITPPSKEQKAKIEEKQMKMEEMKDPEAYRKNKAMYDVSTEVKKFDENYKKGGVIKDLKKAGFYDAKKDKRLSIINKVTTKPERIEMVDKMFSAKKMAKGGTASSRADGIATKGKTKGKIC